MTRPFARYNPTWNGVARERWVVDVDLDAGVSARISTREADGGRIGAASTGDLKLGTLHLQRQFVNRKGDSRRNGTGKRT